MAASIKCDERPFKGGYLRGFAPPAKNRGVWVAARPSQNCKNFRFFFKILKFFRKSLSAVRPRWFPTLCSKMNRSDAESWNQCLTITIIRVVSSWVPPKRSKTAPFSFSIVSAPFSIVSALFSIENGAETKHLNSTQTARAPKGAGSSSRIQMLKSD